MNYHACACVAGVDDEALCVSAGRASIPHPIGRLPQRPGRVGSVLRPAAVARLRPRGSSLHGAQAAAVLRETAVHSTGTAHHQGRAGRLAVPESRLRVPRQRSHQVCCDGIYFTINH